MQHFVDQKNSLPHTLQDITVLISEVRKIILNFKSESKMKENENYSKPTTLIIQYHQNKLNL